MNIIVSACLLGRDCKYNGGNNYNQKIVDFCKGHNVIEVCPEVEGGLPIPRVPAEIVDGVVFNKNGFSVDKEYRAGTKAILDRIKGMKIDMAILQSRSPSCGSKKVYDGTFSGTLIDGQGIFAKEVINMGIKVIDSSEF
ncbi:MAG: DUF523 domain-containing protein [Lachnospiraceae bacterium]|nr:DUF523 domain-containing protein [Lachnospiraceae bacterium]